MPKHMRLWVITIIVIIVLALSIYALTSLQQSRSPIHGQLRKPMSIAVYSPAFTYGSKIPVKYTCDGLDISIPITWDAKTIPPGTKSLVLVMYDPDAPGGVFIHWVLYNIPLNITELPENIPKAPIVKGIGYQGKNSYGKIGYNGPCPPPGSIHRYYIRLLALDTILHLGPGATIDRIEEAIRDHILAYGETMGIYNR